MPKLLVVDDEPAIQHAFRRAFQNDPITVLPASSAAEALDLVQSEEPDVVVLDIHLPDATGLDTFHRIHRLDARIPVILITGHGTTELAIDAIKDGAYEYLLKPLELKPLRSLIDMALRSSRLMRVPASIPTAENDSLDTSPGDLLIGRCPAMQEVYKAIGRVARQDVTVLILGESGTGKELVARAIYQHSNRVSKPFLAVNASALPESLVESELFGHERGAFTGADRRRIGKFEQCNGGTIFLDEIGDMPPMAQAKILRLIQEQRFERVGGSDTIQTDIRLIAATNADLHRLVAEGTFRKDLYFRLNVFTIVLPPLRERGDDIEQLVDHFARKFSRAFDRPLQSIAPETYHALQAYSWPGNVRELQSVLKQAVLHMRGPVLLPEFLPRALTSSAPSDADLTKPADSTNSTPSAWDCFVDDRITAGTEDLYAEALLLMEREVLLRVLRRTGGNQVQAARILGITRGSLRTKIRTHGITIHHAVDPGDPLA
jgi:two-component system nitrogen regulation response regulator GlnG